MRSPLLDILQSAANCERILRPERRRDFIHAIDSHDRQLKAIDASFGMDFNQPTQELLVNIGEGSEHVNKALERLTLQSIEQRAKEVRPIKHSTTNGDKPPVELLDQCLHLPGIITATSISHAILPPEAYAAFMASIDAGDSAAWSWQVVDVEVELTPVCVRFALPACINDRLVVLAFQHGDHEVFNAVAPMDEKPGRFWIAWKPEAVDASD